MSHTSRTSRSLTPSPPPSIPASTPHRASSAPTPAAAPSTPLPPPISPFTDPSTPHPHPRVNTQLPATAAIPHSNIWTPRSDALLASARARRLNWHAIASQHFPGKTANACRKRHERLRGARGSHAHNNSTSSGAGAGDGRGEIVIRRDVSVGDEWSRERLQRVARRYMQVRREMWRMVSGSEEGGEGWDVVEAKCMDLDLPALFSLAEPVTTNDNITEHINIHNDDRATSVGYDHHDYAYPRLHPNDRATSIGYDHHDYRYLHPHSHSHDRDRSYNRATSAPEEYSERYYHDRDHDNDHDHEREYGYYHTRDTRTEIPHYSFTPSNAPTNLRVNTTATIPSALDSLVTASVMVERRDAGNARAVVVAKTVKTLSAKLGVKRAREEDGEDEGYDGEVEGEREDGLGESGGSAGRRKRHARFRPTIESLLMSPVRL